MIRRLLLMTLILTSIQAHSDIDNETQSLLDIVGDLTCEVNEDLPINEVTPSNCQKLTKKEMNDTILSSFKCDLIANKDLVFKERTFKKGAALKETNGMSKMLFNFKYTKEDVQMINVVVCELDWSPEFTGGEEVEDKSIINTKKDTGILVEDFIFDDSSDETAEVKK